MICCLFLHTAGVVRNGRAWCLKVRKGKGTVFVFFQHKIVKGKEIRRTINCVREGRRCQIFKFGGQGSD